MNFIINLKHNSMKQIPLDSKLSKQLFAKRNVDNSSAMGVVLTAIPEGWIIFEGKAVRKDR